MNSLTDKFAAEWSNFIVKEFEYTDSFANLHELADSSDTFIFAVGFPKTYAAAVGVVDLSE